MELYGSDVKSFIFLVSMLLSTKLLFATPGRIPHNQASEPVN